MKRYTRIYIDMTEYVNVTVRNEDSHYACETELQTAPKLELEFHRRLSPSSSHSFRSFWRDGMEKELAVLTSKKVPVLTKDTIT